MNVLRCLQPLRKWHMSVKKSVFTLNSVNSCIASAGFPCTTKISLNLRNIAPLQVRAKSDITRSSARIEEKLRLGDGVPPEYELIYRAPMNYYIIVTQGVSALFSAVVIAIGAFKYLSNELSIVGHDSLNVIQSKEQFLFLIAMFVIATVSLQVFAYKYPTRIYSNGADSYIATYVSHNPFKSRLIEFKAGDVSRIPPSGVMPWRTAWFKVNDKNNIILQHYFRKPADFHAMLKEK